MELHGEDEDEIECRVEWARTGLFEHGRWEISSRSKKSYLPVCPGYLLSCSKRSLREEAMWVAVYWEWNGLSMSAITIIRIKMVCKSSSVSRSKMPLCIYHTVIAPCWVVLNSSPLRFVGLTSYLPISKGLNASLPSLPYHIPKRQSCGCRRE